MKVAAIIGSRNQKGQTAQAVDACLKGFEQANADIESFFLPTCNIERCRQCEDSGWGLCLTEGRCVIEDDFAGIIDSVSNSDVVIFATPVYYGNLSESIRSFLDRMLRICHHDDGMVRIKGRSAVCISVAGGSGGGATSCSRSLEFILEVCKLNILDIIPVRRQNMKLKEAVLQMTAKWIATEELA